jgi:Glyoxalase-like domain
VALIRDIIIDCSHPASLARFWAAALDGYAVASYDAQEIARLRGLGIFDLEDDPSVLILGPGPSIFLQLVPESKQVKNRVHLDLSAAHVDDEVDRLVTLGALVVEGYDTHVLLVDPQGNEFCVMKERGAD